MGLSVGGQHHFRRRLGSEQKGQAPEVLASGFSPSVAVTTLVPLPIPDASARLLQRNCVCVCACARARVCVHVCVLCVKERRFVSKSWLIP